MILHYLIFISILHYFEQLSTICQFTKGAVDFATSVIHFLKILQTFSEFCEIPGVLRRVMSILRYSYSRNVREHSWQFESLNILKCAFRECHEEQPKEQRERY